MTERAMKIGKSPGAHGVPTQHVREDVMKMLVAICRRIWKTKTWSEQWKNSSNKREGCQKNRQDVDQNGSQPNKY